MIDDPSRTNPLALLNTAKMSAISGIVSPTKEYLTVSGDAGLAVLADVIITVGEGVFQTAGTTLTAANLDVGAGFTLGRDYYVYICDDTTNNEVYIISLNTTFPSGYNAHNSRKIGGFHFGRCRRVNHKMRPINPGGVEYGNGWESNVYMGIVPRSVWTLQHRPKCAPEGMVYAGAGRWVDIYISSTDGDDGLKSAHGALPLTGTEGHNWYSFNDRLLMSGKRLLTYAEWLHAAYGSPQGLAENNDNAHTRSAAPANNARALVGSIERAVSAIGCCDCVGNVWEWLEDTQQMASGRVLMGTTSPTSLTYAASDGGRAGITQTLGTGHGPTTRSDNSLNSAQGLWAYDRDAPLGDTTGGNRNNGNIHEYYDQSLVALLGGGAWNTGVHAGARCVSLDNFVWHVGTGIGVRGASDSL
jgi:hypothetical protein